jgi:preprotein translocase subunit SecG
MELVILVVHIFLALAIIATVLIQPPESSGLGGLGGSNPMAGLSSRGQGNILTRMTAILACLFIITSLALAIMASHQPKDRSILDDAAPVEAVKKEAAPVEAPAATPSVPLAK